MSVLPFCIFQYATFLSSLLLRLLLLQLLLFPRWSWRSVEENVTSTYSFVPRGCPCPFKCACRCVHACTWRPEAKDGYLLQSLPTLVLAIRSLSKLGAHLFRYTSWPVSSWDTPVSTHLSGKCWGIKTQVFMLAWHTLWQLSALPSPTYTNFFPIQCLLAALRNPWYPFALSNVCN